MLSETDDRLVVRRPSVDGQCVTPGVGRRSVRKRRTLARRASLAVRRATDGRTDGRTPARARGVVVRRARTEHALGDDINHHGEL